MKGRQRQHKSEHLFLLFLSNAWIFRGRVLLFQFLMAQPRPFHTRRCECCHSRITYKAFQASLASNWCFEYLCSKRSQSSNTIQECLLRARYFWPWLDLHRKDHKSPSASGNICLARGRSPHLPCSLALVSVCTSTQKVTTETAQNKYCQCKAAVWMRSPTP